MFHKRKRPLNKKLMQQFGITNEAYNYRKEMNKRNKMSDIHGLFKHKDTNYIKWLKDQLDGNETRDKLLYYQNDLKLANERANYRNQVDRMSSEIQRDNLNHNSIEQLNRQQEQFRRLRFGMQ